MTVCVLCVMALRRVTRGRWEDLPLGSWPRSHSPVSRGGHDVNSATLWSRRAGAPAPGRGKLGSRNTAKGAKGPRGAQNRLKLEVEISEILNFLIMLLWL